MPAQDGCFVVEAPVRTTRQALATAARLLRTGDIPQAEQAFSQLAREDPSSGEARFFLGLISQHRNDLEAAILHYEQALRLIPDLAEARNNLGVILQSQGDLDEAETCFREASGSSPTTPKPIITWAMRSRIRAGSRRPCQPTGKPSGSGLATVEVFKHLGNALRALGRLDEAIACYDEGLRLAPDHACCTCRGPWSGFKWATSARVCRRCEWRLCAPDLPIIACRSPSGTAAR